MTSISLQESEDPGVSKFTEQSNRHVITRHVLGQLQQQSCVTWSDMVRQRVH